MAKSITIMVTMEEDTAAMVSDALANCASANYPNDGNVNQILLELDRLRQSPADDPIGWVRVDGHHNLDGV